MTEVESNDTDTFILELDVLSVISCRYAIRIIN